MTDNAFIEQDTNYLAETTGFPASMVKVFFERLGIRSYSDLMRRYPNSDHKDCLMSLEAEIPSHVHGF